jgi:hypothetical protein
MEHGRVFVTTREELADRWQVDLANVRPRVLVDEKLQSLLDTHVEALHASATGPAMQAAPMPANVTRYAQLVVVECGPCGHRFMADI